MQKGMTRNSENSSPLWAKHFFQKFSHQTLTRVLGKGSRSRDSQSFWGFLIRKTVNLGKKAGFPYKENAASPDRV